MSRYFFHLRDGGRGYVDRTGVEFPDDGAATEHARCVAAELIKNREDVARVWRIDVQDEQRQTLSEVTCISQDRTLDFFRPSARQLLEEMVQRRAALRDSMAAGWTTLRQSRALLARSRGRPHLVAEHGELI